MKRTPKRTRKLQLSGNNGLKLTTVAASTPLATRSSPVLSDSPAGSPVPFLCTQDGARGESDVVWNFYSPESNPHKASPASSRRNTVQEIRTPARRPQREPEIRVRPRPRLRPAPRRNNFLQSLREELSSLNRPPSAYPVKSDSDSPEAIHHEVLMGSDDSIDDCLFAATQMIEEKFCQRIEDVTKNNNKIESPKRLNKIPKSANVESPKLVNDSFDTLLSTIDDQEIEMLTQRIESTPKKLVENFPVKKFNFKGGPAAPVSRGSGLRDVSNLRPGGTLQRHSSMPTASRGAPVTFSRSLARHPSMPQQRQGSPPMRCTPEEINKKREAARMKLMGRQHTGR